MQAKKFTCKITVDSDDAAPLDLLAAATSLSRQQIKQAMSKGAVWLTKARGGHRRLRRVKTPLHKGDHLELFFDPYVLAQTVEPPRLIADEGGYSVWFKPPKMLSQGSKYGDHCAITRWIEKSSPVTDVAMLVHRLDRAASGLMLVAHGKSMAGKLSALFRDRKITKHYRVQVHGVVAQPLPWVINSELDGKVAVSTILSSKLIDDTEGAHSELVVSIETGRKHQIRRHLAENNLPVVGDAQYGDKSEHRKPLALTAIELQFMSPISAEMVQYSADSSEVQAPTQADS